MPLGKFFLHHTNDEISYDEKAQTMLQEYVSDACQLQVKGTLETLRPRTFMTDKNINDVSEGRTKIVEHINAMTPQCPPDFRSDTHKIDYLRRAVTEFQSWSRFPIQNIISQRQFFNRFVTTLHESIQNLRQLHPLSDDTPNLPVTAVTEADDITTNIAQYGRHPQQLKVRSKHSSKVRPQRHTYNRSFDEARNRNECYKCGGPWCLGHE